jgi:hypothetical protein
MWPSDTFSRPGYVLVALVATFFAFGLWRGLFGARRNRVGFRLTLPDFALCVLLPLYVLSTSNGFTLTSGDNLATRLIAPQIVRKGSLDLTNIANFREDPNHYSVLRVRGRLLPAFPLGTGLLALPQALVAWPFSPVPSSAELAARWEKHFSALCLLASTAFVFIGLRRRYGEGAALATSLVFAFGTTAFSCVGQAMWSTTGEVVCLCLALCLLVPEHGTPLAAIGAGVSLAVAFLCRPSAAIPALLVLAWLAAARRWKDAASAGTAFSLSTVGICASLLALYGHPLGGYGLMNSGQSYWGGNVLEGIAGNLLSPSRGLFPHFPYLLMVPFALTSIRSDRNLRLLWFAAAAVTGEVVVLAGAYFKWWGGYSIGPRLLTEAAPFIAILSLPLWVAFPRLSRRVRSVVAASVLFAALTQVVGVWSLRVPWWSDIVVIDWNRAARWSLRDSQLLATWWPGWYPSWKRERPPLAEGSVADWTRVDLSPAANTRYDLDPFRPDPERNTVSHYPALGPGVLNDAKALFHFGPKGRLNAVTTCRGAGNVTLPLPGVMATRAHLLLMAGATHPRPGQPRIADLVFDHVEGFTEHRVLTLDHDVWEYDPGRRSVPVDALRIYLGRATDPDVLIRLMVPIEHPSPLHALRVENADPESGEGVTLFALTLER